MKSGNHHRRVLVIDSEAPIRSVFRTAFDAFNETRGESIGAIQTCSVGGEFSSAADALDVEQRFDVTFASLGEEVMRLVCEAASTASPFEAVFVAVNPNTGFEAVQTIASLWRFDADLQVVAYADEATCPWENIVQQLESSDRLLLLYSPLAKDEIVQAAASLIQKRRNQLRSRFQMRSLESANLDLQAELGQSRFSESKLAHAATHDGLTGLPNREFIRKAIAETVGDDNACAESCTALMFLDLDNFKLINDGLGHSIGDELLIEFSNRLRDVSSYRDGEKASQSTVVARLGGDEFVLLHKDLKDSDEAEHIACTLLDRLTKSYKLAGHEFDIGVSIGIAFVGCGVDAAEQLMRNADLAMYRAKFAGKQRVAIFDDVMHAEVSRRQRLERELRGAIRSKEFSLRLQPIYRLEDRQLVTVESLLRWTLSDGTEVGPDEFIPLAEETGLIIPIGKWVLDQACQTIRQINDFTSGKPQVSISVNVSHRQLNEPDFFDVVQDTLQRYGIDGSYLNIEITEAAVMANPDAKRATLEAIAELGVRIFLDDFGTGQSSLSCLHRFPIDVVKVDRSLVTTLEANPDFECIVSAIISLAHSFDAAVIGEGIETQHQLFRLTGLGCDWGQGYLLSKPLLVDEILGILGDPPVQTVIPPLPDIASWTAQPRIPPATR